MILSYPDWLGMPSGLVEGVPAHSWLIELIVRSPKLTHIACQQPGGIQRECLTAGPDETHRVG